MPKLCDIVKPGVPCLLKRCGTNFQWDGQILRRGNELLRTTASILFADDWQLDEPTVESVLRERGYEINKGHGDKLCSIFCEKNHWPIIECKIDKSPATVELATAICDLLDKLK